MTRWLRWPVLAAILMVGCSSPQPGGSPSPSPETFSEGELRLALVDRLGPRWWCDPDEYPVGRDEQQAAIERFDEMRAEGDIFGIVARRLGIDPAGPFTDAQKLAVYRVWKTATTIPFEAVPSGDGYRFEYLAQPIGGAAQGTLTNGLIDAAGRLTIERQVPAGEPICPICLVRGTWIDTPTGPVAVETFQVGDAIWTLDGSGRRVRGTVIAIGSMTAPAGHQVIRLVLADGRELAASPAHPLADGRSLGSLQVGDTVDGSAVVSLTWLPYGGGRTFDLLGSGPTGAYFVDGIPTASTIRPAAVTPARS